MKPIAVDLSDGVDALATLAFRGADAAKFLQGQLSADVEALKPGTNAFASLNNPQGRVIALLGLERTAADEILAVLPSSQLESVMQRLRKFVFRAKVTIADASAEWRVVGSDTDIESLPAIRHGSRRWLLVPAAKLPEIELRNDAQSRNRWALADIAEGLPQLEPATSEKFVAQMLNLDVLGAISFTKGCYTGQEVIARAHYRGRVKRRLQRWRTEGTSDSPAIGSDVRAEDGRRLTVVSSAIDAGGHRELLAVGPFGSDAGVGEPAADTAITVQGPLPLPYAIPD